MKTKINKIVVLLLMGLLVCSTSFAETWTEFLTKEKGMWQLQNPTSMDQSLIFSFVGEDGFITTGINLLTKKMEQEEGTYKISGTNDNPTITITVDGSSYTCNLEYNNENKFTLTGGGDLVFARSKSSEDTFMERALQAHKNPFSTGPDINLPIYNTSPTYNTGGKITCNACDNHNGNGVCGGCDGTGKVYGYGGSKVSCSLCGGSGICKFCSGTGYITY